MDSLSDVISSRFSKRLRIIMTLSPIQQIIQQQNEQVYISFNELGDSKIESIGLSSRMFRSSINNQTRNVKTSPSSPSSLRFLLGTNLRKEESENKSVSTADGILTTSENQELFSLGFPITQTDKEKLSTGVPIISIIDDSVDDPFLNPIPKITSIVNSKENHRSQFLNQVSQQPSTTNTTSHNALDVNSTTSMSAFNIPLFPESLHHPTSNFNLMENPLSGIVNQEISNPASDDPDGLKEFLNAAARDKSDFSDPETQATIEEFLANWPEESQPQLVPEYGNDGIDQFLNGRPDHVTKEASLTPMEGTTQNDMIQIAAPENKEVSEPVQRTAELPKKRKRPIHQLQITKVAPSPKQPKRLRRSQSCIENQSPISSLAPSLVATPTLQPKKNTCQECQRSFSRKRNLKRHMGTHTREKPHKCQTCSKSFALLTTLKSHIETHTKENSFKCDTCQKSFTRMNNLAEHMRIHTGEKPYKCNLCEESFANKKHLTRHMPEHTGEKPYKCEACDTGFTQKGSLKKHMLQHSGEKPFTCETCEKSFSRKDTLKKHMGTHSNEKPYICQTCQRSFSQKNDLVRHTRIHTGEKPFKCQFCQKSFTEKKRLTSHMRTHTGQNEHKCPTCQKSFTQLHNMKRHMGQHHPVEIATAQVPVM